MENEREEEERAADERSRTNKRQMAESFFEELSWPVERTLLWIAFRDVDRLFEDNFREFEWSFPGNFRAFFHASSAAKKYSPESLKDTNARRTLLRALQNGSLTAIRDGAELRPEAWAMATERQLPGDVRFRRTDVLRLWPDPSAGASAECEPPQAHRRQLYGEALDQEIRDALKTAIDRQAVKGGKKLNGKEQVGEAMKILRAKGIEAVSRGGVAIGMKNRVAEIADADFKQHRNQPYVTLKSQRAPKS